VHDLEGADALLPQMQADRRFRVRAVGILGALVLSIVPEYATDARGVATTPIEQTRKTDTGQEISVAAHSTGIVLQTTLAPGARTPIYKHPYPRFVYVLDGTLTIVDVATKQTFEVRISHGTSGAEDAAVDSHLLTPGGIGRA
jgi:hypothetical protein